jgi:hypothetical protein
MKLRVALAMIALAALSRLLPHPPNFTPIAAIGLFGAAYMQRRWLAFAVPFAALFLSDLLLNNLVYAQFYDGFQWFTSFWLYLAFGLVIGMGQWLLRRQVSPGRVITASLLASAVFFLVSNLFTWLGSPIYPQTPAGLLSCYVAAIPFFGNTLLGDLLYSGVLFGGYAWISSRQAVRQRH